MPWAKLFYDIAIIFTALIGVTDHQLDWRAGRQAFKNTGEYLNLIGLFTLGRITVLTRFALIKPMLQRRCIDWHTGGTSVDSGAQGRAMTFAPSGDAKKMSKAVYTHWGAPCLRQT